MACATSAFAQSKTWSIAGSITDHATGEALAFVQISVPNSRIGTVSDINGRFDLTVGAGAFNVGIRGTFLLDVLKNAFRGRSKVIIKMSDPAKAILIKENEELSEYVPEYETAKNTLDYLQELFNKLF